jgi:hypothetical protein
MIPDADRAELTALPNVKLTGPMPYQQLPDYMRAFAVCMVPHLVTPFTESLNPIKLWEYLAAGKPIVSSKVAGFRDYPQWVRLAEGAEEFVREIRAALAGRSALRQRGGRRRAGTPGRAVGVRQRRSSESVSPVMSKTAPLDSSVASAVADMQPASSKPAPASLGRIVRGVWKRVRLQWVRLCHPRAAIGHRCDIRKRFELRMGPSAHVAIGEQCRAR